MVLLPLLQKGGERIPCSFLLETSIPTTLFILIALIMDLFYDQPFHHCRSNLFDDTGAPRRWLNLHKSNAANERLADGFVTDALVLGGIHQAKTLLILTAL